MASEFFLRRDPYGIAGLFLNDVFNFFVNFFRRVTLDYRGKELTKVLKEFKNVKS